MDQVSLRRCETYDYSQVRAALEENIKDVGGLSRYIKKGSTILLKVNLLMMRKPEEATTTHPVFVRALSDIFLNYGCQVIIGDSPGGPFNEKAMNNIYRYCGYEDIEKETEAKLNRNYKSYEMTNDACKVLKRLTVIDVLNDVDHVISVSKLKTHGMMKFTGAVKNMFGTIPGILKAEYHFKMPDPKDFSEMLLDVCINSAPVLSFMDGIVGMEGAGPSSGDPVNINVSLCSSSPYHLDVVATDIVGIQAVDVPTIMRCIERGLVKGNLSDIELLGDDIKTFYVESFKTPKIRSIGFLDGKVPKWMNKLVTKYITPKPVFIKEDCILCGECERACPPKAITMGSEIPKVDLDLCIRCYCCQELCPKKAVEIHRPWVLNLFFSE